MRTRLGTGPEFDLIRSLLGPEGPLPTGVRIGPGDDALVLEGGVVVSCDLSVEDVHFRRRWITAEEVGHRAAAAALSDLAAMAAEPLGVLLSLALGPGDPSAEAVAVQRGVAEACRREGVQVLGGDLAASPGPLMLDVVALGRAEAPVLRAGSLPGDELWVTGWLGGSAGAVRLWEDGREPPASLREAFARPRPRIKEARWLAERVPLRAMLDLSDGLAGDAGHLAAAGGVQILLREGRLPQHPGLMASFPDLEKREALALSGGEDYELCFTAPAGSVEEVLPAFRERWGIPLTRVGSVREGEGVRLERDSGEIVPLRQQGFSHFMGRDPG